MLLPNPPLAALAVQLLVQVSRLLSVCPDESVKAKKHTSRLVC